MEKPSVLAITASCGRMRCLRRSLTMFLEQDYDGPHTHLIFNNSDHPLELRLPELPSNKQVILVNSINKGYKSLGEIYNDCLLHIPDSIDIVYHQDDDDYFLPNHISEGVKGMERNQKIAYKPRESYYRHAGGVTLLNNVLEPSIFLKASHLKEYGYHEGKSVAQHHKWLAPLEQNHQIASEEGAPATFIYNWSNNDIPVFKTSGAGDTPTNFGNYRSFSQDFGDYIVAPVPVESYNHVFKEIPQYV
jgi:hypothetical protein